MAFREGPSPEIDKSSDEVDKSLDELNKLSDELNKLPDEEFVKKFPKSGFGWEAAPNPNNDPGVDRHNAGVLVIRRRHDRLKRERPDLYIY
jgi:hypothetical protein